MKPSAAFLLPLCLAFAAAAAPVPIFDGKTLEGWEGDAKWWRVADGALTGGSATEKVPRNFFLATTKSYHNFDLRLRLKLTGDPKTGMINSGVQIRSVRVPDNTEMSGYQVDAGDGWWGKLYDESRRNKVLSEARELAAVQAAVKPGDWNEFRIRAEGPRIQSWINGVAALDYTEAAPNIPQDGHIALQIHSGGMAVVQVKDVTIEELPPTPNAPTWEKVGQPGGKKKAMKEGNVLDAGPRSPEEERAAFTLPEGFEVELIAAEDASKGHGKFVPIAFDQRGALWTTTALEYPVDGNENPAAAAALYAGKAKDKVLVYDRDPQSPTGYVSQPRVFAEGLAIPLGVLPYQNGCYVQHGPDIAFLEDTDADGKADKRTVILTGFGVQDSHLFPHQFMRAPGGWLWMAQGAFNYSKVRRPDEPAEKAVPFDQTRMAKFRPDGSEFTITSNGPCNIWGLVLNGVGEAFIQEANDFGYPVMPFHEYANYPGCSDRQWKSYAPEFPGTAPDFRMGGTGLSGLALTDARGPFPEPWRDVMLVANPITNRIQAIKMHRDGPYWRLEKRADFLVSADPWFRPVAITIGPDGCLYIVDWYNKIISHNEVPRNHPDRDKTRGRIWRVTAKAAQPFAVPDFTKLSGDELIAKLGGDSLAQSHLAWQVLVERKDEALVAKLRAIAGDVQASPARRIAALWVLEGSGALDASLAALLDDGDRNVRREAVRCAALLTAPPGRIKMTDWNKLTNLLTRKAADLDPEVRMAAINALAAAGRSHRAAASAIFGDTEVAGVERFLGALLVFAREPLAMPTAPSTRNGKPIKVREAYDREFERYLVRMSLEQHPAAVAKFLDSDAARELPVEAALLASLALEPKASAARVAKLLPQIQRAPGTEEVLRLAQFPEEPGVGAALAALLANGKTSMAVSAALLEVRTKLDGAKLAPFMADAAKLLLNSKEPERFQLGLKLAAAFKLAGVERQLVAIARDMEPAVASEAVRALSEIGSGQLELFTRLAETAPDASLREAALTALTSAKSVEAPARAVALYPKLDRGLRRRMLDQLATTKAGANALVTAVAAGTVAKGDLDAATLDRLVAVLGEDDPTLAKLLSELSTFFRPVLVLDGSEEAWVETGLTLDGPLTVETWVRLDPDKRKIGNADGILGAPGQLDLNFYDGKFRAYVFPPHGDVAIAKKPIAPGMWTHVAATRDAAGIWRLYLDGELEATATQPVPGRLEGLRLGWTSAPGGTRGAFAEYRIWNVARTANEIRATFDRSIANGAGIVFQGAGRARSGAKTAKTSDLPPVLTADQAAQLDAKFAKYTALAAQPGDIERGKQAALACTACHLIGPNGGQIGPNLSGIGAMGVEAILRNLLTPNAAMESAYRIYRVEQRDGSVRDAFFVSEEPDAIVIRLPGAGDQRLAKKEVVRTQFLRRSLMPEGLLEALGDDQARDLLAYLLSLK
jgi:putative membrane-bound dehydrogenase-like protein